MSLILDGTNGLSDIDGTAATPAIRGTDTNTGIFFPAADTIAFSEGGTESMRIDGSGNVGIGTTSPTRRLHVRSTDGVQAIFETTGASAGVQAFTNAGSFTVGAVDYTSSAMIFYTGNGTSGAPERMRIDSSGNLLVGTTSAGCRLSIGFSSNSGPGVITNDTTPQNGNTFYQFRNNGTTCGSITSNGATTTTYGTGSDYRLKENIAPMTGALAKVAQLKPCTYTWKVDGSDGQGFIAHELQAVVPDAVVGEKDAVDDKNDPKYQMVDTSFLVATLTAAIQELKAELDSVKAELATLKA